MIPPTCLLLVALLAIGCGRLEGQPAAGAPEAPLEVMSDPFEVRVLLTGELRAVRAQDVLAPPTRVWQVQIQWLEEDGAPVQAGQPVAELDNSQFVASLADQRLAAVRAANDLEHRQAQLAAEERDKVFALDRARIELEKARLRGAVPSELLSRREAEQRGLALERAAAEVEKARAELDSFRASARAQIETRRLELDKRLREIDETEHTLEQLVLRAPGSGILILGNHPWEGRRVRVGDPAWPGLVVARIPDLTHMEVRARLADVDDGRVEPGMTVSCRLDAYPDEVYTGTVVEVSATAREAAFASARRAFDVRIALDRSDPERMRPGMSVKVMVDARSLEPDDASRLGDA